MAFGIAGTLFFAARTAGTTISMVMYDRSYDANLAAIEHIPHGARLVSFVGRPCVEDWAMSRLLHLPAMAIVRREAFSNDQWVLPGAQLLTVHYDPGERFFIQDASQIVTEFRCRYEPWRTIDQALAHFPRRGFDYVWLIDPPPPRSGSCCTGCMPIWREGTSVLYRVVDRTASVAPRLSEPLMPALPLSIVVPCYNEEACLRELHVRLTRAAEAAVGAGYEIVLVNDGSRDRTWEIMRELAAGDPRLVAVNLSRNHGHQLALTAGLDLCVGAAHPDHRRRSPGPAGAARRDDGGDGPAAGGRRLRRPPRPRRRDGVQEGHRQALLPHPLARSPTSTFRATPATSG